MKEEVKIGLEIHGYIITKEKLFCKCKAEHKNIKPNTNICPICTAQPGSKPMLPNIEALKKIIQLALMLGCKISPSVVWQRKHYDWPDLPKGYQDTISGAYSIPVGEEGEFLNIRIKEVHLEEDPARWDPETGHVDYNRCGVPLAEIVTHPDFTSAEEVRKWLQHLLVTLSYIYAVEEDAGIKADVNVSVNGERVEIKNVNSLYNIVQAIKYEIERQKKEIAEGRAIKRETRAFDEKHKSTIAMREKEEQADYRFIPDPDLPVINISHELTEEMKKKIPELPKEKMKKYKSAGVEEDAAKILTSDKEIAEFFEKVTEKGANKKLASYWITIELLRVLNWNKKKLFEIDIRAEHFAELLKLIEQKKITEAAAKKMLNDFVPKSFSPSEKLKHIERISDSRELEKICQKIIEKEKKAAQDFKAGEEKALHFLIGKVMQETEGRADSKIVKEILLKLMK